MIMPSIDPVLWREEMERVSTSIIQAMKSNSSLFGSSLSSEWITHLNSFSTLIGELKKSLDTMTSPSTSSTSASIDPTALTTNSKSFHLTVLSQDVLTQLNQIQRSEALISSQLSLQVWKTQFQEYAQVS